MFLAYPRELTLNNNQMVSSNLSVVFDIYSQKLLTLTEKSSPTQRKLILFEWEVKWCVRQI